MAQPSRRDFLQRSTATLAASAWLHAVGSSAKAAPSERIRVGFMGAAGRATSLIDSFARNPAVDVIAIAEIDPARLPRGLEIAEKHQGKTIRVEQDFRKLVDDPTIDALVIGTPDHWHAIPTIMACQAGKDVYVEKPDSHNIVEGQTMVAAMRKHRRIVQMVTTGGRPTVYRWVARPLLRALFRLQDA